MTSFILDDIDLEEISGVDNPAQPTAKATIIKRADNKVLLKQSIVKAYAQVIELIPEKSKDFNQQLQINEQEQKLWAAREKLWPLYDTLRDTVINIIGDAFMTVEQKKERIEQNAEAFAEKVISEIPDISTELVKHFQKAGMSGVTLTTNEDSMTPEEIEKKVSEAVEAKETELAKAHSDALTEAINAAYDIMFGLDQSELEIVKAKSKEERDEFLALSPEERKKKVKQEKEGDEIVKFEGNEIRKSAVGDATFALYKRFEAMEIEIQKSKESELNTRLEKRASEEFGNLPGTDAEKASVLKAVENLSKENADALYAIMKMANEANAEAFEKKGSVAKSGDITPEAHKEARDTAIEKFAIEKNITRSEAWQKMSLLDEHKHLFTTNKENI